MASLFTVLIAGIQYLIHPQKLGTIQETINPDAIIPVTLLTTEEIFGDLEGTLKLFDVYDDVFTPEFGSVLVEKTASNASSSATGDADRDLPGMVEKLYSLDPVVSITAFDDLPSGPYILHGPNLYQAWRLYEDSLDAFTFGVIPEKVNKPNAYTVLNALSPSGAHNAIPVPSRLYQTPPRAGKPLSNIRIAISDTCSLKGVPTTLSSRSWSELHAAASTSTAQFVQTLIGMGAVIVGKAKTSQFDVGKEWVDVAAPWSPRADGYQDPSGASAGEGSALAGYEWLQRTVANDVEGVRDVAAIEGLYSIRTTLGSIPLAGSQSISSSFDAAGFSARLIDDLYTLTKAGLNSSTLNVSLPKKLLIPKDFDPGWSSAQRKLHGKFVAALENLLAVKAQPVDLAKVWADSPPSEADGESMGEYMKDAFFRSLCYEFYSQYKDFQSAYQDRFNRQPFAEATPQFRWETGKNVTKDAYLEQMGRIEVYKKWFNKNIMPLDSKNGSDTVMILPIGAAEPHYRTESPGAPASIEGITSGVLAPILQTPQLVAPFAQLPYESKVSGNTEYLPVSGSIMGPREGDLMLIQTVKQAWHLAQWRARVETGKLTFPLADNPRNVDDQYVEQADDVQTRVDEL